MPEHTILVVEDEFAIAALLQDVLEDEGYTVVLATDGHQALTVLEDTQPAAILSDIRMPGMDGLALCAALQQHPVHQRTPVLLMSANANQPPADTCTYTAFIAKPFRFETVLATVAQAVAAGSR